MDSALFIGARSISSIWQASLTLLHRIPLLRFPPLMQWQYKRRNVASNLFEKCHQRDVVNSDEAFHGLLPRRALIGPRDVSGWLTEHWTEQTRSLCTITPLLNRACWWLPGSEHAFSASLRSGEFFARGNKEFSINPHISRLIVSEFSGMQSNRRKVRHLYPQDYRKCEIH